MHKIPSARLNPKSKPLDSSLKKNAKDCQRDSTFLTSSPQKDNVVEQIETPMAQIESKPLSSFIPTQIGMIVKKESSSLFSSSQ